MVIIRLRRVNSSLKLWRFGLYVGRGRGRGSRVMNQDENANFLGTGIRDQARPGLELPVRQPVERSAEKLVVGEEEGSASPVPERVLIS